VKRRKWISLLLCGALILATLPTTALAEGTETEEEGVQVESVSEEVPVEAPEANSESDSEEAPEKSVEIKEEETVEEAPEEEIPEENPENTSEEVPAETEQESIPTEEKCNSVGCKLRTDHAEISGNCSTGRNFGFLLR
jgi:hypothetical protein